MLQFSLQSFEELTTKKLYDFCKHRCEVFVVEQNCTYQDLDDIDLICYHLQGFTDNKLAVYARIIPPNVHPTGMPAIGRVLTVNEFRGRGYAKQLMQEAIKLCQIRFATKPIYLSAQTYLIDFYQSLGFLPQGEIYLEDNIPHIDMVLHQNKNE